MQDRSIARPHYPILAGLGHDPDSQAESGHVPREIGSVTSGTLSPSLNKGIALGYVQRQLTKAGTEVQIDIRGRSAAALIVKPPFYKQGSVRKGQSAKS
jgi:aminomethyltransferase